MLINRQTSPRHCYLGSTMWSGVLKYWWSFRPVAAANCCEQQWYQIFLATIGVSVDNTEVEMRVNLIGRCGSIDVPHVRGVQNPAYTMWFDQNKRSPRVWRAIYLILAAMWIDLWAVRMFAALPILHICWSRDSALQVGASILTLLTALMHAESTLLQPLHVSK